MTPRTRTFCPEVSAEVSNLVREAQHCLRARITMRHLTYHFLLTLSDAFGRRRRPRARPVLRQRCQRNLGASPDARHQVYNADLLSHRVHPLLERQVPPSRSTSTNLTFTRCQQVRTPLGLRRHDAVPRQRARRALRSQERAHSTATSSRPRPPTSTTSPAAIGATTVRHSRPSPPAHPPRRQPRLGELEAREQDYYQEGELLWLDADTLIRQLTTDDKKSLTDFPADLPRQRRQHRPAHRPLQPSGAHRRAQPGCEVRLGKVPATIASISSIRRRRPRGHHPRRLQDRLPRDHPTPKPRRWLAAAVRRILRPAPTSGPLARSAHQRRRARFLTFAGAAPPIRQSSRPVRSSLFPCASTGAPPSADRLPRCHIDEAKTNKEPIHTPDADRGLPSSRSTSTTTTASATPSLVRDNSQKDFLDRDHHSTAPTKPKKARDQAPLTPTHKTINSVLHRGREETTLSSRPPAPSAVVSNAFRSSRN